MAHPARVDGGTVSGPSERALKGLSRADGAIASPPIRLVDEIAKIFPGTELAAEALFVRSRHRRARENHEGALWDLLDAADQGTGEWSLRAAFRAGVHCQMMEWRERAQVVFERLVAKWPLTLTAARAAGELAYIHRDTDKAADWEDIQVDILHRLVLDPRPHLTTTWPRCCWPLRSSWSPESLSPYLGTCPEPDPAPRNNSAAAGPPIAETMRWNTRQNLP